MDTFHVCQEGIFPAEYLGTGRAYPPERDVLLLHVAFEASPPHL